MNESPDQPNPDPNNQPPPLTQLPGLPPEVQKHYLAQVRFVTNQVAAINIIAMDHICALANLTAVLANCAFPAIEIHLKDNGKPTGILSAAGVPIHREPGPRNRLR